VGARGAARGRPAIGHNCGFRSAGGPRTGSGCGAALGQVTDLLGQAVRNAPGRGPPGRNCEHRDHDTCGQDRAKATHGQRYPLQPRPAATAQIFEYEPTTRSVSIHAGRHSSPTCHARVDGKKDDRPPRRGLYGATNEDAGRRLFGQPSWGAEASAELLGDASIGAGSGRRSIGWSGPGGAARRRCVPR
jgi:hypothetical protein